MKIILILEDNKRTLDALAKAASEVQTDIQVYTAQTIDEAYAIAFSKRINLFLLDIILTTEHPGDTSGFQFAQNIRGHEKYKFTPIIFITSLEDQHHYAYSEIHSYSYLEKPFSMQRVKKLIEETLQFPGQIEDRRELYVRTDGILQQIKLEKVIFVESQHHKLEIYMTDGMLEVPYYTIKWFLKEASNPAFFQCSRNTVVNRHYIDHIDVANRYICLRGSNRLLEIGIKFRKQLLKEISYD